tara:strand:- start:447 stop:611 length:165 start_codon:yes stop_codon:yes gene_type:complete
MAKRKKKALSRKLQRTGKDQYTLTIPKALVQILHWKEQDDIQFELEGKTVKIKK